MIDTKNSENWTRQADTSLDKTVVSVDSYFDGNTMSFIGYRIVSFLVCAVTLGIAFPWMHCMLQRWEARHTVIHGRRLRFDGRGGQLFGKCLLWVFLTLVTFGIYSIWLALGVKKWTVKHTFYADDQQPVESYFSGGVGGFLGIHILAFLLTLFTLGIGNAWASTMILKWEAEHTHIGVHIQSPCHCRTRAPVILHIFRIPLNTDVFQRKSSSKRQKAPKPCSLGAFEMVDDTGLELQKPCKVMCKHVRVVLAPQQFPGFGVKCCAVLCGG